MTEFVVSATKIEEGRMAAIKEIQAIIEEVETPEEIMVRVEELKLTVEATVQAPDALYSTGVCEIAEGFLTSMIK